MEIIYGTCRYGTHWRLGESVLESPSAEAEYSQKPAAHKGLGGGRWGGHPAASVASAAVAATDG